MRLLELKIKNIASLKGEHSVSFRDIVAQSPLFAITGETGSGKSSILNSIGLVLYGDIFKKSVQQNDVVTLGEKEGQIELLFQVREKTYFSTWRARVLKQNGEPYSTPQSPVRELYEVDGSDFNSPKTIVTKSIEEILQLDFDQFCKCIILNQGEFAKFLGSTFSDRKAILEKLYPGDVLEGLSARLRLDLEEAREGRKQLDVEMQTLKDSGASGEDLKKKKTQLDGLLRESESSFRLLDAFDQQYRTLHHYFEENQKNQKKIESTRGDIADLTRTQNENLAESGRAQEAFESARKVQAKEQPRLQELLKLEEKESAIAIQKNSLTAKVAKFKLEAEVISKKLLSAREQEVTIEKDKTLLEQKLTLPASDLRIHQKNLESLFDLHHEMNLLKESEKNAKKRLDEYEEFGKERSRELKEIQAKKEALPKNFTEELARVIAEREKLKADREKKHRAEVLTLELTKTIMALDIDFDSESTHLKKIMLKVAENEKETLPLRTTKKLSGLLSAVSLCRTHETTIENESCPVCETKVPKARWKELQTTLAADDLKLQLERLEVLEGEMIRLSEEKKSFEKSLKSINESLTLKKSEMSGLEETIKLTLLEPEVLEQKLALLNQQKWELDQMTGEENKLLEILKKTREDFSKSRTELLERSSLLEKKNQDLSSLRTILGSLIPQELTGAVLTGLKSTLSVFKDFRDRETQYEHARKDRQYLDESMTKAKTDLASVESELEETIKTHTALLTELKKELGSDKASDKIKALEATVRFLEEEFKKRDSHYRRHDQLLKEASGRLIQILELVKEIELHFFRARDEIRVSAAASLVVERESLRQLISSLKSFDLDLSSIPDLYIPVKELVLSEKEFFAAKVATEKEGLAATVARLADWEKRQDRITLLELKSKDITGRLQRLERLYTILGKDDLRTFVLSLVEENLIAQTNEELQKLCQGRYEIVHQSKTGKITPEFYVLDKFRDGGFRKVGTLSGGETFMVSLAMALALAEMTRGQAEIDSLFIDEGFGTLDQDSLEDVLDMLNQIQTRGLMVGVISHIKALTNSLPVNLMLNKRHDGTSTLSLQYN